MRPQARPSHARHEPETARSTTSYASLESVEVMGDPGFWSRPQAESNLDGDEGNSDRHCIWSDPPTCACSSSATKPFPPALWRNPTLDCTSKHRHPDRPKTTCVQGPPSYAVLWPGVRLSRHQSGQLDCSSTRRNPGVSAGRAEVAPEPLAGR